MKVGEFATDQEAVRLQVSRLLDDPLFHHSQRYSSLLKYIVERSLEGAFTSLKERVIGVEVFGRPADYDTSIDSTVRVVANEVRKRLAVYYAHPTHKDELHIDVPVRSYIAEFKWVESPEERMSDQAVVHTTISEPAHIEVESQEIPLLVRESRFKSRATYLALLSFILLAVGGSTLYIRLWSPMSVLDQFWAPMATGSQPTLICISSSPNPAPGTASGQSDTPQPQAAQKLYEFTSQRVNVSMTDVTAASGIARLLHTQGKDSVIRPAHGTNLADLQAAPAVLLGSFTNEWAVRFGSGLHFRLKKDSDFGLRWIEDSTNPSNKAWIVDMSAPNEQVANDYALVSRVLDLSTGRWWIGISGLTGTGTLAAYQLTTDPKMMRTLTAELPKGWENKNLQFVVQVRTIQGSPGASHVVAKYIW